MKCRNQNRGFGIIDLLVSLAMVALVMTLLLPVALRVRGKSRLADCKSRLQKIAIAAHDFHDAFMRLPPGTLNYMEPVDGLEAAQKTPGLSQDDCQNLSALFLLLPFVDPEGDVPGVNLYDTVDGRLVNLKKDLREITNDAEPPQRIFKNQFEYGPGAGVHYPEGSPIQYLYSPMEPDCVASTKVTGYLCPDDTLDADLSLPSVVVTMPFYNSTSLYGTPLHDLLYVVDREKELARTNYVAVAGTTSCINVVSPLAKWGGAMTGRQPVTLVDLANLDGSSNTFMFGESLGDVGGISKVLDSGQMYGLREEKLEAGKRTISRSWVWGGLGILASYNFPWGNMDHPDIQDPENEGVHLKLLGNGRLADPGSFSAVHDEGVNFVMCDASAHTVPREIAWQLYYGNGGMRDGVTERGF